MNFLAVRATRTEKGRLASMNHLSLQSAAADGVAEHVNVKLRETESLPPKSQEQTLSELQL